MPIERPYYGEVSDWWWLPPLFFGAVGGLISYVATKDVDSDKAMKFLIFGIFWSIVPLLILWFSIA